MKYLRSPLLVILLSFCFVLYPSGEAFAEVYVKSNFYLASGFVIGGLTIFLFISFGSSSTHAKNETPLNTDDDHPSSDIRVLRFLSSETGGEQTVDSGLVKIFEW